MNKKIIIRTIRIEKEKNYIIFLFKILQIFENNYFSDVEKLGDDCVANYINNI